MAYPTAAEAKAKLTALAEWTDAQVSDEIDAWAELVLRYCGIAGTSTAFTYTVTPDRATTELVLPVQRVLTVSSVTTDGAAVASSAYVVRKREGIIYRAGGWSPMVAHVVVGTHGYSTTPVALSDGACEYALAVLRSRASGTPREITSQSVEGGWINFRTPDWNAGRPTGWVEGDRLLNQHRSEAMALGFA